MSIQSTKKGGKNLSNLDVRTIAKENGVRLWEIADKLGISEPTITRKLRRELPADEKKKILAVIDEIAAAKKKTNAAV